MKFNILYPLIVITLLFCSVSGFTQEADTSSTTDLFELSLEDLMNVEIVSAVRQNQNITDAPSIVSVITEKQIKDRGYLSVDEALNSIAGLDVITDHFQPNLGIRGINGGLRSWSRLVKVMIDGQNISFRSGSDNYLDASLIPIEAIEKIEIIRGPNSALFGKNAFLGVINIITKSGSDVKHASITHYLASTNENPSFGISTLWGGTKDDFDFVFASSFSQIDQSGLTPKNVPGSSIYKDYDISQKDEANPFSVFTKLKYENEKIGKIILDANQQIINSYAEFDDWGTLTHNNKISMFNSYERLSYSKDFFENFNTDFSLSHSRGKPFKKEIFDTNSDHSEWIEREVGYSSYDLSGNLSFFFDDINNFSLGIDYTSDIHDHQKYYTVTDAGVRTLNPGGTEEIKNFNNLGIYLQMIFNAAEFFNVNFLKNLTLTAGYRFDYHNIYGDVLTYRLAAVYHLASQLSTKVMYGTSFNAPSSAQLYTNSMFPGDIIGNPDLKPEKAKTLEWAIMGKLNEHLYFNLNLFYTIIDDKIEYLLPYSDISNITAANIAKIYSAGLESEINLTFSNSTSYLNYSYQQTINERTNPLLGLVKVETSLYPHHMIKFGETYKLPKFHVKVNMDGHYISQRKASEQNNFIYDPINYTVNSYSLDSYLLFNLMISSMNLKFLDDKETILSFKINNLLNTTYYYPGFKDFDIPGLGRFYTLKITQLL